MRRCRRYQVHPYIHQCWKSCPLPAANRSQRIAKFDADSPYHPTGGRAEGAPTTAANGRSIRQNFRAQELEKFSASPVEFVTRIDNMVFATEQTLQTFTNTISIFNAVLLITLAFKAFGAHKKARRLEIAIGEAKASLIEYNYAPQPSNRCHSCLGAQHRADTDGR